MFLEINSDGYIELQEELPTIVEAKLLGLLRGFWTKSRMYAADGTVWRPVPVPGQMPVPSLALRLLANTVYNPRRRVAVSYERDGRFTLDELKAQISGLVARDDDILTPFMDVTEIEQQLGQASRFTEVVALLRRMRGAEAAQQGVEADEGS
jgi:hypothetical protein